MGAQQQTSGGVPPRCAIVGAGWAGLAAAVRAVQAGWQVELLEMASTPGGRARTVAHQGTSRDNGQHILIGAYVRTLNLMRTVGVDPEAVLARSPLSLIDGLGRGLTLKPGPAVPSFIWAVLSHTNWSIGEKLSLLRHALAWRLSGFSCEADLSVAQWSRSLPARIREELIDPLCVAALNTPSELASASVMLRVLQDALFAGPGSADLLLPRTLLGQTLPEPAVAWLRANGATIVFGERVNRINPESKGWLVDGRHFDQVVLACSAKEAGRLAEPFAAAWAAQAQAFTYEPIITVWLSAPEVRAPASMILLRGEPAQFGFDLGQLDQQRSGTLTLVVSGASRWIEAGMDEFREALDVQLHQQWRAVLPRGWQVDEIAIEKRATFRCKPGLVRPSASILPGLQVAGDYVAGPYPATLEGAVRSGEDAIGKLASYTKG